MRNLRCITAVVLLAAAARISSAQSDSLKPYPAPKHLGDPARLGIGVQRTMALLAASTPQHRNTVRILFYGQSITEQDWWKDVAADLRRRFPDANLLIENRALGGFASQLLVKTAESDLYSFYPDLMIFHVYGAHTDYADIIRRTRERTTAEVLIQTDHATSDADLTEETDPSKLRPDGKIWNSFMNYLWLPDVAAKYGCGLVDQRNLWKQYLRDNNLHASQLLKDGVHQNAFGNYLMAEIVKAYLVRRPDAAIDPMQCDTVRTIPLVANSVSAQKAGPVIVPFDGNRVDLIAGDRSADASAQIRIDGKKPSEMPELYGFTRALASSGGKWPVVLKIGSESCLRLEEWTMDVVRNPADPKVYRFSITGSVTGPDGAGRSDQRFVSNSRRIVIEPQDWNVEYSFSLAGVKPPPDKFTVRWQVVPHFVDSYKQATKAANEIRTTEDVTTVAQGLSNGPHVLELRADAGSRFPVVQAIRVYKPPVKDGELVRSSGPGAGKVAVK